MRPSFLSNQEFFDENLLTASCRPDMNNLQAHHDNSTIRAMQLICQRPHANACEQKDFVLEAEALQIAPEHGLPVLPSLFPVMGANQAVDRFPGLHASRT